MFKVVKLANGCVMEDDEGRKVFCREVHVGRWTHFDFRRRRNYRVYVRRRAMVDAYQRGLPRYMLFAAGGKGIYEQADVDLDGVKHGKWKKRKFDEDI